MIEAVSTAVPTVIGWVGDVVSAMTGESGELAALLPLFAIGIAVSAFAFGVRAIRSITWGA
ncbi:MAG: hypothetical protein IKC26_04675 [Clostridia bacterium]|nr:hypothetical protein [Clostridia bacterium]